MLLKQSIHESRFKHNPETPEHIEGTYVSKTRRLQKKKDIESAHFSLGMDERGK